MINVRLGLISKICGSLNNHCTPIHKIAQANNVNIELVYLVNDTYNIRENIFTDIPECLLNMHKTLDNLNSDLEITLEDRLKISHLSRHEYYKYMKSYGIMHAGDRRTIKLEQMVRSKEYTSLGIAKRLNMTPESVNTFKCRLGHASYYQTPLMSKQKNDRMKLTYDEIIESIHKRMEETEFVEYNKILAMRNKADNCQSKLVEKIINIYLNTEHNDKEISEICNCSRQHISLARKLMHVPSRQELRRLKIRDELMYTSKSLYDIADQFSVSMVTVRNIVKKFNIVHRM